MALPTLGPPPLDNDLVPSGKVTPTWNRWLRQLWDTLREPRVIVVAHRATAQTGIASATRTTIDFDVVDVDSHSAVTTGASWKFTAPRAGYYRVEACVLLDNIGLTPYLQGFVYKNGSEAKLVSSVGNVSGFSGPAGSATLELVEGDEVDFRVHHGTGSNQQTTNLPHEVWIHILEDRRP